MNDESLRVPLETIRAAIRQRHHTSPRVLTRSRLRIDARTGSRENGMTKWRQGFAGEGNSAMSGNGRRFKYWQPWQHSPSLKANLLKLQLLFPVIGCGRSNAYLDGSGMGEETGTRAGWEGGGLGH